MDYIRRELLRQQAALARLLLGGGKENEEQPADAASPARRDETSGYPVTTGNKTGNPLDTAAKSLRWQLSTVERLPEDRRPTAESGDHGETAAWAGSLAAGAGPRFARRGPVRPFPPADSGETAEQGFWRHLETGERSDEKALSRMIQRDARRYDGGFSLY